MDNALSLCEAEVPGNDRNVSHHKQELEQLAFPTRPAPATPGCTRRSARLGTAAVLGSREPFLPSPGLTLCLAPYQLLSEEAASPAPLSRTTEEQLWLFAHEAEVNKDYKLASLYHQQVKESLCSFLPVSHVSGLAASTPSRRRRACVADSSASPDRCVRRKEVNVTRILRLNV